MIARLRGCEIARLRDCEIARRNGIQREILIQNVYSNNQGEFNLEKKSDSVIKFNVTLKQYPKTMNEDYLPHSS